MVLGVRIKKELICIYLKTLARSLQNALSLNVYKLMIDKGGWWGGLYALSTILVTIAVLLIKKRC